MHEEAINSVQRFMDASIVEALITFLAHREKKDWPSEFYDDQFPMLQKEEKRFRLCLERMEQEALQLFEYTSPHFHKSIVQQYVDDIQKFESTWTDKKIIRTVRQNIKDNNIKVDEEGESARIVQFGKEKKTGYLLMEKYEWVSPKLTTHKHFPDYLDTVNILWDDLKSSLSLFLELDGSYKKVRIKAFNPTSIYEDPKLENGIIQREQWNKFIAVCDYFRNEIKYENKGFNKFARAKHIEKGMYNVIGYDESNKTYKWLGFSGEKTQSLRSFVLLLRDLGIFRINNKTKDSIAFFRFFDVLRKDNSYLLRGNSHVDDSPYHNFFENEKEKLKILLSEVKN